MMHKTAFINCVDNLKKTARMLKRLEWSGVECGQGSGFMGSGTDGPRFPACPVCRGIKPGRGHGEFIAEAFGHKQRCSLKNLIKDLSSG